MTDLERNAKNHLFYYIQSQYPNLDPSEIMEAVNCGIRQALDIAKEEDEK